MNFSFLNAIIKPLLLALAVLIIGIVIFFASAQFNEKLHSISADKLDAKLDGKLVHVQGPIKETELRDPIFAIETTGLSLKRIVEVYQWQKQANGEFIPVWSQQMISNDKNQQSERIIRLPFSSEKWGGNQVQLGVYTLDKRLEKLLNPVEKMPITEAHLNELSYSGQQAFKHYNNAFYFGLNPEEPQVGDIRISYERQAGGIISVVAEQKGTMLVEHHGAKGGIAILQYGNKTAQTLLGRRSYEEPTILSMIVKGLGTAIIALALYLFVRALFLLFKSRKVNAENSQDDSSNVAEPALAAAATTQAAESLADINDEEDAEIEVTEFVTAEADVEDNILEDAEEEIDLPSNVEMIGPDTTAEATAETTERPSEQAPESTDFDISADEDFLSDVEEAPLEASSEDIEIATEEPLEMQDSTEVALNEEDDNEEFLGEPLEQNETEEATEALSLMDEDEALSLELDDESADLSASLEEIELGDSLEIEEESDDDNNWLDEPVIEEADLEAETSIEAEPATVAEETSLESAETEDTSDDEDELWLADDTEIELGEDIVALAPEAEEGASETPTEEADLEGIEEFKPFSVNEKKDNA